MARDSRIEWTDHTFNPWWGCTKVSPACDHCYAEAWAKRLGLDIWSSGSPRRFLSDAYWHQPKLWNKAAEERGTRARVFCASMADVFEWKKGLSSSRAQLWRLIDETPFLDWLLLTKRPHLVKRLAPWDDDWPPNVWLGTTVEDQKWVGKRLPYLAANAAAVRFLSCEPLLGSISLEGWLAQDAVQWVIAGGESGPKARPSDPAWFLAVRDQCVAHKTAFHFKQWGDWAPLHTVRSEVPRATRELGYSAPMGRFGKKISGRTLDGRTWDGVPHGARIGEPTVQVVLNVTQSQPYCCRLKGLEGPRYPPIGKVCASLAGRPAGLTVGEVDRGAVRSLAGGFETATQSFSEVKRRPPLLRC